MSRGIGACDMKYCGIRVICREAWIENFNYLYIDMTRDKKESKYRNFNERKKKFFNFCFHLKIEKI